MKFWDLFLCFVSAITNKRHHHLGGPDRAVSLHALHPGIASAYIQDAVCISRKYRNPFFQFHFRKGRFSKTDSTAGNHKRQLVQVQSAGANYSGRVQPLAQYLSCFKVTGIIIIRDVLREMNNLLLLTAGSSRSLDTDGDQRVLEELVEFAALGPIVFSLV